MIVISDTSGISNLLIIDEIEILRLAFDEVVIPPAVHEELSRVEGHRVFLDGCAWIRLVGLSDRTLFNRLSQTLDIGESEAIALALEINADFLLIDEARGREVAHFAWSQYNWLTWIVGGR